MSVNIIIGDLTDNQAELAERKGMGHPDTLCDEIVEEISRELCRYYRKEFGAIMHHNVDKALLIGGRSQPSYGGGKVVEPISLIIAGRAMSEVQGKTVPVEEIAVETAKTWLQQHMSHLHLSQHIDIGARIRSGSADLVELFNRMERGEAPLANDTSFGAGFYPLTALERTILTIEQLLNDPATKKKYPFIGEDIKVMGARREAQVDFTIAIAMVDKHIADLEDYMAKVQVVKDFLVSELKLSGSTLQINTADDYKRGSIYLTVTGTSAEHGDDGQVGRGNRVNGLITPYKPMSLEAASGKNPVSHTGKIYNYLAMDLSKALVEQNYADEARVFALSQIGKPIDEPKFLHFQMKNKRVADKRIEDLAREMLREVPGYWKRIVYGEDYAME